MGLSPSVENVKRAIGEFQPYIVAVELDLARFEALEKQAREPSVAGHGPVTILPKL